MPKRGQTKKQAMRAERQENHRAWLSEKCKLQHFVDNLNRIENLDPEAETFNNELAKYKEANAQRLKVMNKYLPDLKNIELANDGGGDLVIRLVDFSDERANDTE